MQHTFNTRFEAAHRFTVGSGLCTGIHGHTWWVRTSFYVNDRVFVDFATLKRPLHRAIDQCLDHALLLNANDVLAGSLPAMRLVLFPVGDPTTENVARLMFMVADKITRRLFAEEHVDVTHVQVDETPTNTVTCYRTSVDPGLEPLADWMVSVAGI